MELDAAVAGVVDAALGDGSLQRPEWSAAGPVRSLDGAPVRRSGGTPAAQEFGSGAESTAALVG